MSPELARNGRAQPPAVHGLGVNAQTEPEGSPELEAVHESAEQGSSAAASGPSKPPLLVEFPSQAMLCGSC